MVPRPGLEALLADRSEHGVLGRPAQLLHDRQQERGAPRVQIGARSVQQRRQRLVGEVSHGGDLAALGAAGEPLEGGQELRDRDLGIALDLQQDAVCEAIQVIPMRRDRQARSPLLDH
jgi:hypothetical protein